MTATDTAPDTELVASCNVIGHRAIGETFYAACTVHGCAQLGRYAHRRTALQEFVCDHGHGWRFIIQYEPHEPPTMVDLSGLATRIERDRVAEHLGDHDGPPATIWRWVSHGQVEPVTVTHIQGTGEWARPQDDKQPATAYPQYLVAGPDGTEFARVIVTLDEV